MGIGTERRGGRVVRARTVVLGLVVAVVVAALGAGLWIGLHLPTTGSTSSVFDQTPSAGESQPISLRNLARVHPVWAFTFAGAAPDRMAVANGVVYLNGVNDAGEYVIAIEDGRQVWRYDLPHGVSYVHALRVAADAVYVEGDAGIFALDARTGQVRWQYHPEVHIHYGTVDGDLAVADGLLFYPTADHVVALDATRGTLVWSYRFSQDVQSAYSPFAPVLVAGAGTLFLALATSPYVAGAALTALNDQTGQVRWQVQELGAQNAIQSVPILVWNGVLYWRDSIFRSAGNQLTARDAASGKVLWSSRVAAPGSYDTTSMAADGQRLYLDEADQVHALDLSTGHEVWASGSLNGRNLSVGPAVSNGVIYVATVTPYTPRGQPIFTPARAPHWLYALDATTGHVAGMLQDNDSTYEPRLFAQDATHLYVLGGPWFLEADSSLRGKPDLYALGV